MIMIMCAAIFLGILFGLGVTAGVHRLWCHRSYKARLPLQIFLAMMQTSAMVGSIFDWCRDHRVHHKYSETDADPHNANRGFFFSHMGWLLIKKHPLVIEKGKSIYLKDLLEDPVISFQRRYYYISASILGNIAIFLPWYLWDEPLSSCIMVVFFIRYVFLLHAVWSVNSFAHAFGYKPYNKIISPTENIFVSLFALGEGFHNYHHSFPWDYSTSELGWALNISTFFIDLMAKFGLAYDLKTAHPRQVLERRKKYGDLCPLYADQLKEDAKIFNKEDMIMQKRFKEIEEEATLNGLIRSEI
ncbi:SCD [Cordylochernes scorpioides]|uniref:SCD n=1 Tax=Cordylochernes scorpioides TaxID=51811 RepID=A0ABY6LQT1_9ARAC|nr:SCD [Cordylochernes scorpioides]